MSNGADVLAQLEEDYEDEVDLSIDEIRRGLKLLRPLVRDPEVRKDPELLAAVKGLIRRLEGLLSQMGRLMLIELGESAGVQEAIATLKAERKKLNRAMQDNLRDAATLKRVAEIANGVQKAGEKIVERFGG